MANLNKYVNEIELLNATIIAISPELPEFSQKIIKTQKLNFDILFDKGNKVAEQFGIKYVMPDYLIELYRDTFQLNLNKFQDTKEWALPMPGRFLVDRDGIIKYAESDPDYTMRPDPENLIQILKTLPYISC